MSVLELQTVYDRDDIILAIVKVDIIVWMRENLPLRELAMIDVG